MGKNSAITRRTIIPMLAIVLILCLLCGCTPELRAEDGVKSDLSSSSVFQQYFVDGQSITDFTVTKRQTDTDNKTDTAWVEVWAENEEKSADLSFIMQYTLYNDGWLLENVAENRESQWEFTPESGPSEDLINSVIPAEATNILPEDFQGGNDFSVEYSLETDYGYRITRENYTHSFYFDTSLGIWNASDNWELIDREEDYSPLIGTWKVTKDSSYTDADTGKTITYGAELEITEVIPAYSDLTSINDNEIAGTVHGTLREFGEEWHSGWSDTPGSHQVEKEYDLSEFEWHTYSNWMRGSTRVALSGPNGVWIRFEYEEGKVQAAYDSNLIIDTVSATILLDKD